jgi:hypothetical protein
MFYLSILKSPSPPKNKVVFEITKLHASPFLSFEIQKMALRCRLYGPISRERDKGGYAAVQAEATLTTQRMQVYSRRLILLKQIKHRWVKPK